ncbi:josephin-like protein [Nicotiana sylvestris]|uniref:Josephin-like protein n=2 Tax=Nicotiana TaxID=4085 RepID=A0A1S4A2Q2_TOBAC|nr:PREDICTED: josephin-like protein [Nicotiana sylvestris]XP_016470890.1 PREDICTED: josephin-like protein [Nicotiana tabacum]
MSRRVSFSPDHFYDQNNFYVKKKPSSSSNWNSRLQKSSSSSEFSVASFLKNIGTKVASALNFLSNSNRKRSSRKVSSASLARSRSYAETIHDSQRAEAIEDCIEFLNSSSSCLHRSSSVSSTTCQ